MGVLVNDRIYVGLFILTAVVILGALLWGVGWVRNRAAFDSARNWSWVLLTVWLTIVFAAHVWYNVKFVQPQGRYLFPALIPIAAFWVVGLNEWLRERYARLAFVLLYGGMLALDCISLYWYIVPQLSR